MNKTIKQQVKKFYFFMLPALIWFLTSLALSLHAWISDGLADQGIFSCMVRKLVEKGIISEIFYAKIAIIVICFVFYTLISFLLFRMTPKLFRPVQSLKVDKDPQVKVLVISVSLMGNDFCLEMNPSSALLTDISNNSAELTCKDIGLDIQAINSGNFKRHWPWQQILRGIKPHKDTLEAIYVVFSGGEGGSIQYKDIVLPWLGRYFEGLEVKIIPADKNVKAKDLSHCYEVYNDAIEAAISSGYDEEDVIVDITGGTAVQTSAASFATLHNKTKIQYVKTDGSDDVVFYNSTINFHKQPIS